MDTQTLRGQPRRTPAGAGPAAPSWPCGLRRPLQRSFPCNRGSPLCIRRGPSGIPWGPQHGCGGHSDVALSTLQVQTVCAVAASCLTLCGPMDRIAASLLSVGFSRQEYWSGLIAIFSSRGSSQVTEENLFALVLDTLLLQLVIFADICKVLWRVMVFALSQGAGRLPSSVSSWACSSLLCSSQP